MGDAIAWLRENVGLLVPLLSGAAAVWLMMPRVPERRGFRAAGAAAGLVAIVSAGVWLTQPTGEAVRDALFYLFAAAAVASGALMVTNRNPVYAALWFALATLSVCGLFLLR
ncbi:MAG TPA: NADH-quinone oxidoreductase subunit J, partial [Planctomycetaceae bacterium]